MKICVALELGDVIMDVKYKFQKQQGFCCHRIQIRLFPLTLHMGLTTMQLYRADSD